MDKGLRSRRRRRKKRRRTRQEGCGETEGKWRRKERLGEIYRMCDGTKDGRSRAAAEEDPSDKLPPPPSEHLSSRTPLSALIRTRARLCHTLAAQPAADTTSYGQTNTLRCTLRRAARTHRSSALITGDKGACHRGDADRCRANVRASW